MTAVRWRISWDAGRDRWVVARSDPVYQWLPVVTYRRRDWESARRWVVERVDAAGAKARWVS